MWQRDRRSARMRCASAVVAWMSGLIDGEGNVHWKGTPTVRVNMIDLDLIERVALCWRSKVSSKKVYGNRQSSWCTSVCGANAVRWTLRLYPWFSVKKRSDCRRALTHWSGGRYRRFTNVLDRLERLRPCYWSPLNTVAWLAGLIDGEAHISWSNTPRIILEMTDHDIVRRVSLLWQRPMHASKHPGYKPTWRVSACAATAVKWLLRMYPFFGLKKKADTRRALEKWTGGRFNRYPNALAQVLAC